MSVRKIKESWWVDIRFAGVRHRLRSPANSREGAHAYESAIRQRLAAGCPILEPQTQAITFAAFAAEWYAGYVKSNNKLSEQKTKEICLRVHLLPFFGKHGLREIGSRLVEQYKAEKLAAGLAPKTINNHLAILSKCIRTARDWEVIEGVPRIKLLRVPPQPYDFLTVAESERLLQATHASVWRSMVLLALRTGMRLGEMLALDWSDVDMERRLICVRRSLSLGEITSPKNNRARYIAMANRLHDQLSTTPVRTGYVLTDDHGRHVTKGAAAWAMTLMCRSAGLRAIGWHALRHTFASHLVAASVPLRAVQELLGHSTIHMTERYAHLAPASLRSAVAVLDAQPHDPILGQPVGNHTASALPALAGPAASFR